MNTPEMSLQIQFNAIPPAHLNWAGCQWVIQLLHLSIHITLMFLQFDICILPKSHI